MFTAMDAKNVDKEDLDHRIEWSVSNRRRGAGAYIRIYHDDNFNIEEELSIRGFKNIDVPNITLSGDVWFEW